MTGNLKRVERAGQWALDLPRKMTPKGQHVEEWCLAVAIVPERRHGAGIDAFEEKNFDFIFINYNIAFLLLKKVTAPKWYREPDALSIAD